MLTDHFSGTLSELDRLVVRTVPPGGNWRDLPDDFPSLRIEQIRRTAAAGEGSRSTYYGRLQWDRPAYTISTFFSRPGNGCYIHPSANRLITVREAARLQSFPDAFRFSGPSRSRFAQVGNAVPPLLAYQLSRMFERGSVVDLFSGCGGLSLGCQLAGFQSIAAADYDLAANDTFMTNGLGSEEPIALDLGDPFALKVAVKEIRRRAGDGGIDLLAGGPPCQGFSTAGQCLVDDKRNRLVLAFVRAVAELRPRSVLMENVAALAFRRGASVLAEVLAEFDRLGYRTQMMIAHAEGYGLPQLRRRFFLVATTSSIPWPNPWAGMLQPGHFKLQPVATGTQPAPTKTTFDAISDLPENDVPSADDVVELKGEPQSRYQRWARGDLDVAELVPPFEGVEPDPTEWERLFNRARQRH